MTILAGYLLSYGYIGLVFVISFVMQKLHIAKEEGARKIIHVLVCFTWIIMELFFDASVHKIVVPLTFVLINWISIKRHLIPGMDREVDDSYGTVFYAISLTVMNIFAFFNDAFVIPAGMGIFALSFGDGFAAVIGKISKSINIPIGKGKSLFGTLACIFFTFFGLTILNISMGYNVSVLYVIFISVATAILEYFGGKYDNLVIPAGVFAITYWVVR